MPRGAKKCKPGCTCGRHRPKTEETRRKLSERTRASWGDPLVREVRSRKIKANAQDPEWKKKHSEIMREINSRPEVKAKLTGRPREDGGHWATLSEEYYRQRSQQGNTDCDICKLPNFSNSDKRHHVDHCHKTGKIRGLLCSRCNGSVGHIEKDRLWKNSEAWRTEFSEKIAEYLGGGLI